MAATLQQRRDRTATLTPPPSAHQHHHQQLDDSIIELSHDPAITNPHSPTHPARTASNVPSRRRSDTRLSRFWRSNVQLVVPHTTCKDYLALERTYLAFTRTAVILAMIGVLIAQLFRLQNADGELVIGDGGGGHMRLGFFAVGKGLACLFAAAAMVATGLGAAHFFRQQKAMQRGKYRAGGWEVKGMGVMGVLVVLMLLILVIVAAVRNERNEGST